MYTRNKTVLVLAGLLAFSGIASAQKCRTQIDALKTHLATMVLTTDALNSGNDCSSFIGMRGTLSNAIDLVLKCNDASSLHPDLTKLKASLNEIGFNLNNTSKGEDTRSDYYRFAAIRESFANTMLQFETTLITAKLQSDIEDIVGKIKEDIQGLIKPLSSISSIVRKEIIHRSDSIADTLDARLVTRMVALNTRLTKLENQFSPSPLYTGINWFTQNGLGFGVHYHIAPDRFVSPLASFTILYQWRGPENDQDTPHNNFGATLSGGISLGLSSYNRLGFMADFCVINNESKVGARLMTYNQYVAVGIGYNEYMGADISLLIRFHDPR